MKLTLSFSPDPSAYVIAMASDATGTVVFCKEYDAQSATLGEIRRDVEQEELVTHIGVLGFNIQHKRTEA